MSNLKLKVATVEYMKSMDWKNGFAVTFTCKEAICPYGDMVWATPQAMKGNLRFVLNKLNKKLFGNSYRSSRKFKKKLQVASCLERNADGRYHFHLAVKIPEKVDQNKVLEELVGIWRASRWGYPQCDIKPMDDGWLGYMAKLESKHDYSECIDWDNSHFSDFK